MAHIRVKTAAGLGRHARQASKAHVKPTAVQHALPSHLGCRARQDGRKEAAHVVCDVPHACGSTEIESAKQYQREFGLADQHVLLAVWAPCAAATSPTFTAHKHHKTLLESLTPVRAALLGRKPGGEDASAAGGAHALRQAKAGQDSSCGEEDGSCGL